MECLIVTIGDCEILTSGIKGNVIVECSVIVNIQCCVEGYIAIDIQCAIKVNRTYDVDCSLDNSITIICVNRKLFNIRSVTDDEFLGICRNYQIVCNLSFKLNVQGAFDNSVTSCTFNSKLVSSIVSNSKVGIDVNSAVNLNVTIKVSCATDVEVFGNTCATSHHQGACCRCLPGRSCISC